MKHTNETTSALLHWAVIGQDARLTVERMKPDQSAPAEFELLAYATKVPGWHRVADVWLTEEKARELRDQLIALLPLEDDTRAATEEELAALRAALTHRTPYVGSGIMGARRSAQIDREEADTMDAGEARDSRLASADRWDEQAAELEAAGK